MFSNFPFIDYDTFEMVSFDVFKFETEDGDVYNVHINFLNFGDEDGVDGGLIYRTGIYGESLKECAGYISMLIDLNLFHDIEISTNGLILSERGEPVEFNWNDSVEANVVH